MKYTVEQRLENRYVYNFEEINEKKERLVIEVTKANVNLEDKNTMMNKWKKAGYIEKAFPSYWSIDTYIYDSEGGCWMKYNPAVKKAEDGTCRNVINFDWILEATEENLLKILEETYSRFMKATGKSATEIKMYKINEYAKMHNMKIYETIPEGFKKSNYGTCTPPGTILLTNGKSFLSGELEEALLLI